MTERAPAVRPMVAETVSLGAAYAAGLAVGYWSDLQDLRNNRHRAGRWLPAMDAGRRAAEYCRWQRAVDCAVLFSSADEDETSDISPRHASTRSREVRR
jgi:glycerol kinase